MSPLQDTPAGWLARLRQGAFADLAGCQVSPVVLRIRDDGPALLDDLVTPLAPLGKDQSTPEQPA